MIGQRLADKRPQGGTFGRSTVRWVGRSGTSEHPNTRTPERFWPETHAAIEAAEAAGRILLRHFGRVRAVRLKRIKDPVTAADVASQRCIKQLLHRRFPGIGFLGEEGDATFGPNGRWIVDPLDGTLAFISGLPFFAVSIALERHHRIESGVILLPRLGEVFVAERGRGAWLNGRRVRVSKNGRLINCVVSLWHDDTVWGDSQLRERIAALALKVRNVRIFGACFSLAYVAAGRLDAYWEQSACSWDVAAGALLVTEAGGRVTDGAGRPFDIEQPTILASNGRIHRHLVTALNGRPARTASRRS
jgi:myo-inositol-1(or 4)-monophosphatase